MLHARSRLSFLLMLAWAYILSARWTEIMPGTCSLTYTESQATTHQDTTEQDTTQHQEEGNLISVQLGDISPHEARWWAAILAPGQGWQAELAYEQQTSLAPWSICLQQSFGFLLLHTTDFLSSIYPTATFSDATHYLNRFCARHIVFDQSQAALASVLLIPSMGSPRSLRLPTPSSRMDIPHIAPGPLDVKSNDNCIHSSHLIDKLLTLSCNTRGIRPLLLSVFYEPRIECNAVTPWLQGTLAAIKHVASNNSYIIGRLCMERSPRVAFLWLGCIILDLQDKLLQEAHFGQIPIDLHSAAWSGTIQSFSQQRVSSPLVTDGSISRADECRLLFLSQYDRHIRIPVCQWKPFGKTPVENVDIEARVHQQCEDHWLQYEGISWGCEDGNLELLSSQKAGSQVMFGKTSMQETGDPCTIDICYDGMARDREAISENATRNIFGWLRPDGHAQGEQDIWKHEWFDMSESDDDDIRDDKTLSDASARLSQRVESWVLDTKASTSAPQASRAHSPVSQLQAHQ
ncbi:immunoglobulin variable region used by the itc63b heavy chain [Fusarium austroafricanum]|uniref:Immunoglobulin variable region used by the itc63b heavy chain n=1 Tax=Fusarium austroafricanum TaxID=2364996 RepID=A0A8H4NG34_9HYPO|nr:immunoglobulin variable region used by the itc63b heavy chain [Fusarium austroafricanum]